MKERAHYACVTRPDCIFATLHNPPPTFLAGSPSLSKTPFWCEQLYTQQSSSERREVLVIWTSAQDLLTLLLTPKTCTLESGYHSQNRSWPPKDDKVELCHAAQFFPNESLVRSHWSQLRGSALFWGVILLNLVSIFYVRQLLVVSKARRFNHNTVLTKKVNKRKKLLHIFQTLFLVVLFGSSLWNDRKWKNNHEYIFNSFT